MVSSRVWSEYTCWEGVGSWCRLYCACAHLVPWQPFSFLMSCVHFKGIKGPVAGVVGGCR